MNEKTPVVVALSSEEVMVIMAYLRGKGILGVDPEYFKNLSTQELKLVMETAEHGLIARNLINLQEDRFVLQDVIQMLINMCQSAEKMWVIKRQHGLNNPGTYYVYSSSETIVFQSELISSIHQFVTFPGKDFFLRAIFSILGLPAETTDPKLPSGRIPKEIFSLAQKDAISAGDEKACAVLQSAGLPEVTAKALAASLANQPIYTSFIELQRKTEGRGIAILQSGLNLWLLKAVQEGQQNWAYIEAVNDKTVVASVKAFFL